MKIQSLEPKLILKLSDIILILVVILHLRNFLNNQTVAVRSSIRFINCEFKTHGFHRIKWDELNSRANLNLIFDSCTMSRLMKFMWKHYSLPII